MTQGRHKKACLLVAGIGNIFLGDDGFGVEVAQRLLRRPQRDGVKVVDFGIRGLDLSYALLDGCDAAILIDALPRGEAPGTLFILEPHVEALSGRVGISPMIEPHSMDPMKVLKTVTALGGHLDQVFVVGCEPSPPPEDEEFDDDMRMGLSAPVAAAIDEAVAMVESLAESLLERILKGTIRPPDPAPPPATDAAAYR